MASAPAGYFDTVSTEDLVAFLGERHLDRSELPPGLEQYVEDALGRGMVFQDCRHQLAALV